MTYLELCVQVRELSGMANTGPTDVTSQSGEYLRLVNWVKTAWTKIQTERLGRWKFLHTEFTKSTVVDQQDYEFYTADGIRAIDNIYIYLPSEGVSSRVLLREYDYADFRRRFIDLEETNKPQAYTITPNNEIRLYPVPDAVYTLDCDAFLKPVILAANSDTPTCPEDFHIMIVYRSLMDYSGYIEGPAAYQYAAEEYKSLYKQFLWTQLYDDEALVVRPM